MWDSWISDLSDKVTAGVVERLWAIFVAILRSLGWGTALMAIGALLVLILIFKLLNNIKVLAVLAFLCLVAGYAKTSGLGSIAKYVTSDEDAKRIENANRLGVGR